MIVSHLIEVCLVITIRTILSIENKRRDKLQEGQERNLDETAFGDMTDRENPYDSACFRMDEEVC